MVFLFFLIRVLKSPSIIESPLEAPTWFYISLVNQTQIAIVSDRETYDVSHLTYK